MSFVTWAIHLRYALIILLLVVIIILMSKWTGSGSSTIVTQASVSRPAAEKLVSMSHDAMSAVETAATPTDALMHTAYADAYLAAAEAVAPDHAKALQLPGLRHKVRAAQHAVAGKVEGE
jgi:hypothetical protein